MRSLIITPCRPRPSSSAKRGSRAQSGSPGPLPISLAQRRNSGLPVTATCTRPSVVVKMSIGAEVWPRLPVATRLIWVSACSISVGLVKATAVASSAPVTIWPRPVCWRSISAARVPKAQCSAVPRSTQLTAARVGSPGWPVM